MPRLGLTLSRIRTNATKKTFDSENTCWKSRGNTKYKCTKRWREEARPQLRFLSESFWTVRLSGNVWWTYKLNVQMISLFLLRGTNELYLKRKPGNIIVMNSAAMFVFLYEVSILSNNNNNTTNNNYYNNYNNNNVIILI